MEGFVVVSFESLVIFVYDQKMNQFQMSYLSLEQAAHHTDSLPLCAMTILADYKNQYFKQGNIQENIGMNVE